MKYDKNGVEFRVGYPEGRYSEISGKSFHAQYPSGRDFIDDILRQSRDKSFSAGYPAGGTAVDKSPKNTNAPKR